MASTRHSNLVTNDFFLKIGQIFYGELLNFESQVWWNRQITPRTSTNLIRSREFRKALACKLFSFQVLDCCILHRTNSFLCLHYLQTPDSVLDAPPKWLRLTKDSLARSDRKGKGGWQRIYYEEMFSLINLSIWTNFIVHDIISDGLYHTHRLNHYLLDRTSLQVNHIWSAMFTIFSTFWKKYFVLKY